MRFARSISAAAAVALMLQMGGLPTAAADTALVDYTCDLPSGATGVLAAQIPDTVAVDDLEVTVVDTPDPVVRGQNLHLDLDVPFPDFTAELPDVGIDYGFFYVKQIDITQPLPAGINFASVVTSLTPSPNWATVTREFGNLKIHIQSAVPGSRIRINPDVTPPTIEIEESPGVWVPLDFIPSVDIDATVNGAAGSSINWRPPTLNAKVKYNRSVFPLITVNWEDADTPCTPNDPNQTIVSTLVASPSMSATLTRSEAAVTVGQTIHYQVAVQNTGDVALTGVTVAVPNATCDAPPASIAVGATANVACSHVATAGDVGTYTRSASVDTAETAATTTNSVSSTVVAGASMSANLSRTEASVTVGQTIHYQVAVQNTGGVPLTGVTVAVPNATCDPPPASIAVGTTAKVACTRTTTAGDVGTYTRSASVDTAETAATTTNSVSTTVNPRRVADAAVATAASGPFSGGGTYSGTVIPGQTKKANVARAATRTFYVQVGNDGDAADSFTVRGVDTGAAGYKVKYFDAAGVNITAAVKAGTYVVPDLAAGATVNLRVTIKATATSTRGSGHKADVRITSTSSSSATDIVRAKVKRT